ncbi:permease-like cell division protein FtsX [Embleya sp. NPDC059259]|uniref:permease-like cell division protein FtsX n=1 Tax=unclassified Embleya TaxID=2699296 RepID=UPI0036C2D32A
MPTPTAEATWRDPWLGRADVSVFLCGRIDERKEGCAGGPVTAARRDAIRATLESFPEIREIFHESPRQAHETLVRLSPEKARKIPPEYMPDSFRVKLKDPSWFSDNLAGLRGTSGVSLVIDLRSPR